MKRMSSKIIMWATIDTRSRILRPTESERRRRKGEARVNPTKKRDA